MPGSRTARRAMGGLLVGLLLALLAAPSAHAGPVKLFRAESFLDWLWEGLARAFAGLARGDNMMDLRGQAQDGPSPGNIGRGGFTKEGGMMDPHGQPQGAAAPGGTTGGAGVAAPGT